MSMVLKSFKVKQDKSSVIGQRFVSTVGMSPSSDCRANNKTETAPEMRCSFASSYLHNEAFQHFTSQSYEKEEEQTSHKKLVWSGLEFTRN